LTLAKFQFRWTGQSQLRAITRKNNVGGSQLSGFAANLDFILQILLELSNIQNFVRDRLGTVDNKLNGGFFCFWCPEMRNGKIAKTSTSQHTGSITRCYDHRQPKYNGLPVSRMTEEGGLRSDWLLPSSGTGEMRPGRRITEDLLPWLRILYWQYKDPDGWLFVERVSERFLFNFSSFSFFWRYSTDDITNVENLLQSDAHSSESTESTMKSMRPLMKIELVEAIIKKFR
jgi:hypothetical protein